VLPEKGLAMKKSLLCRGLVAALLAGLLSGCMVEDDLLEEDELPSGPGAPLGAACAPDIERVSTFNGFQASEVNLESNSPACRAGICLLNHFQGRVTCPYGQSAEQAASDPRCFVPGTEEAITVPVDPQLVARQAADASICSCRCAGPGPGPFCKCPGSMQCAEVIEDIGLPNNAAIAGSYCIPRGTVYDHRSLGSVETCDLNRLNCER
jgi:hypothetical protein